MTNDPSGPERRPLRRDAARNRELLVQAAREVFAARGFEASMDDIAHHAGLGVGTAYRHFTNKYELANAIFDTAVAAFVDSAEEVVGATNDAWDAFAGIIERTLEAQSSNRAIREILLGVNQSDSEHHDTMVAPFSPLFERAKAAGAIRVDAEFSDVGMLLVMLCTVADTAVDQNPYLWRRYLPMLLAGLRPDGPALPGPALTSDEMQLALDVEPAPQLTD